MQLSTVFLVSLSQKLKRTLHTPKHFVVEAISKVTYSFKPILKTKLLTIRNLTGLSDHYLQKKC